MLPEKLTSQGGKGRWNFSGSDWTQRVACRRLPRCVGLSNREECVAAGGRLPCLRQPLRGQLTGRELTQPRGSVSLLVASLLQVELPVSSLRWLRRVRKSVSYVQVTLNKKVRGVLSGLPCLSFCQKLLNEFHLVRWVGRIRQAFRRVKVGLGMTKKTL